MQYCIMDINQEIAYIYLIHDVKLIFKKINNITVIRVVVVSYRNLIDEWLIFQCTAVLSGKTE